VKFERVEWKKNKKFTINVEAEEIPNRGYVKHPPPFMYHPELYPQRALNNPKPFVSTNGPRIIKVLC